MDSRTLSLIYGFVANWEQAITKAESHQQARWELAEGTTLVFDAYGDSEEVQGQVRYTLRRNGPKFIWTIEQLGE